MQRQDIFEGATVRSRDGEKLGKITVCGPESFIIEKGLFFHKEYAARYEDVAETHDGEVVLSMTRDELFQPGQVEPITESQTEPTVTSAEAPITHEVEERDLRGAVKPAGAAAEEVRVPLREEQLQAEKQMREAGEVKIKKEVVTEAKTVTVPVQKEVVRVETVKAKPGAPAAGEFKEQTVTVPVREEEVEVTKRPVVKEEVRITKGVEQHDVTVGDTVRKEKVDVKTRGDVKKTDERRD